MNNTKSESQITHTFEKDYSYQLCLTNKGSSKQHVFLDFPIQASHSIGTSNEINEGVTAIQFLSEEIEKTAQTVKESIQKTMVFDITYDEMESSLYASFFVKATIVILICALQCWLFMKLMGKKTIEYKRVSIPI